MTSSVCQISFNSGSPKKDETKAVLCIFLFQITLYFLFTGKMPREVGPEKRPFGGEDGLITESTGGRTRHFWRCAFCNWEMGGKNFQNNKARIHLSGDHNLRNGLVSIVCNGAPDNIKEKFAALERCWMWSV